MTYKKVLTRASIVMGEKPYLFGFVVGDDGEMLIIKGNNGEDRTVFVETSPITGYDTVDCGGDECNIHTKSGSIYHVTGIFNSEFWGNLEILMNEKIK